MSPQHPDAVIEATNIVRVLGDGRVATRVLDGITLSVAAGEWLAIMGPSGSGKSTLLQLMGGLDRSTEGTMVVAGVDMHTESEARRATVRRHEIGYVFQQHNLLADLSAEANVAMPLQLQGTKRRAALTAARALLHELGLRDRSAAFPAELSGGERQRVAVARSLIIEPAVLLADEPTGALDSAASDALLAALDARHRNGQTIVMVTHDHRVAARAQRIVAMRDGKIVDEHRLHSVIGSDLPTLLSFDEGSASA